jgi:hypothetical protein
MSETRILIRLLRIYFPWHWEFGSALSKLRNFGACGRQIRGVWWVDFFLFSCLKSIMKVARFADVAVIQERVTAVLRSIPKEALLTISRSFMNVANSVL